MVQNKSQILFFRPQLEKAAWRAKFFILLSRLVNKPFYHAMFIIDGLVYDMTSKKVRVGSAAPKLMGETFGFYINVDKYEVLSCIHVWGLVGKKSSFWAMLKIAFALPGNSHKGPKTCIDLIDHVMAHKHNRPISKNHLSPCDLIEKYKDVLGPKV